MPRKYVKFQGPNMGIDAFVDPLTFTIFNEVSFDNGQTWTSITTALRNNIELWKQPFSIRKVNSSTSQHWFGWSGTGMPSKITGHTYMWTYEIKSGTDPIAFNLIAFDNPSTSSYSIVTTTAANSTNYTRVYHIFTGNPGKVYFSLNPPAGITTQFDIRDLRVIDVTDVDPIYYDRIGRQEWYAIRTALAAIDARGFSSGLTRQGNLLSIDTASEYELASGVIDKAITADKLKSWINHGDNYKVKNTSGSVVHLVNLASQAGNTYMDAAMLEENSTTATFSKWFNMISIQGHTDGYSDFGGGCYFVGPNGHWLPTPCTGKYLITVEINNETSKPSTYATFTATYLSGSGVTTSSIESVPRTTQSAGTHKWVRCAMVVDVNNSFWLSFRVYGVTGSDQFRVSFRDLRIYNVTNIHDTYYQDIANCARPLLEGVEPVDINRNVISYLKTPLDVAVQDKESEFAQYRDYILDAGTLNDAINLGRGVDVTCGPLVVRGFNEISFDGGLTWESIDDTYLAEHVNDPRWKLPFFIRNTNTPAGVDFLLGWIDGEWNGSTYNKPFPKVAPNLTYMNVVSVANMGLGSSVHYITSTTNGTPNDIPHDQYVPGDDDPEAQMAWGTFDDAGRSFIFIIPSRSAANQLTQLYFLSWRQYEVTNMSIWDWFEYPTVADDPYAPYIIKQDAVCPFVPIIDMHNAAAVTIASGLAYRLNAISGTHTLSVDTIPDKAQGEDAYIIITTASAGTITVKPPLILMNPIVPNAINNCRVTFNNGEARIYVDSYDSGYVVTVASGTDNGTLFYGMAKALDPMMTTEFISVSSALDETQIEVSGVVASLSKPISITGNGIDDTDITFLGGNIGTNNTLSVNYATVRNFKLLNGVMEFDHARIAGDADLSGGTITFGKQVQLDATIENTNVLFKDGTSVSGTGTIDLMQTSNKNLTIKSGSLNGITIKNGRMNNYGGGFWTTNSSGTVNLTGCTITGCSASKSGGGFSFRYTKGSIVNCTITDCISGTWGGCFETSYNTDAFNPNVVRNLYAYNCQAANGGAIGIYGNRTQVYGSTISHCTATSLGNAIGMNNSTASISGTLIDSCSGKSVVEATGTSSVSLAGCTITGCTVNKDTGLLYSSTLTVEDSIIEDNLITAGNTGISRCNATYTNCVFQNNQLNVSGSTGGLFYLPNSTLRLTGCTFSNNSTNIISLSGSGMTYLNNVDFGEGAIYSVATTTSINISGTVVLKGPIYSKDDSNFPAIYISSGATISLYHNGVPSPIKGSLISAQGSFTVIDSEGNPHTLSADTKANSQISNQGVWT